MSLNSVFYSLFITYSTLFYQLVLTEKPDDGCGQSVFVQNSGRLSSKTYPGVNPNNSWCEWKIRVPGSFRIVLKFEDVSIEGEDCETDYLKILKEIHGTKRVYWQYCGRVKAHSELYPAGNRSLYTDSSEVTVSFRTSHPSSSRGFQLSYSTVDHRELFTCSDGPLSLSHRRRFCPAGCGVTEGDVVGDVSQGYRHTSVLCKAAVHAGVILDQYGGPITVEVHSGLRHYNAVQANGIQSKEGSLSDSFFTFITNDCNRQTILQPVSTTASWERNGSEGPAVDQPPKDTNTVSPTGMWTADTNSKQYLQLDLGEKKRITVLLQTFFVDNNGDTLTIRKSLSLTAGLLTRRSISLNFVKRYKIEYREKSRWRTYSWYNGLEDQIFEGNVGQTLNTFHPAITARYVRVVPLQWQQGISLFVDLLGCSYTRITPVVNTSPQVTQEALPIGPKTNAEEADITEPLPSQTDIVKPTIIVVSTVMFVILVLLGICLWKLFNKKKNKDNTYNATDPPQAGCWKQVKHMSARHQSTEFTFSYDSEKDPLPKMDLVTSDMADYQQPLMPGVGTVSRKGSTFRPMDTDTKDEVNEAATHYDYLQKTNQYALPLTNQEPEYATPIIERHPFRKDGFLPDPSYSVPGVVRNKSPSFKTKDGNNRKVVGNLSGGYQMPQIKPDRVNHSEGVYDSPKIRKPAVIQNGGCSDYQRPQPKPPAQESYSTPRDCVLLDSAVPSRLDLEGAVA